MPDIQKEAERLKNQATEVYTNTSVRNRNIFFGVVALLLIIGLVKCFA